MQLQNYIRILLRRGWIMAALALITAVAALGFSLIIKERAPLYTSKARILIQPARTDFGLSQAALVLLGSYESWMNSTYRAEAVIDQLQLDMTPLDLLDDVRIAGNTNTFVLEIEVEHPDGDIANDIARTWANLFIQWRNDQNQQALSEERIDAELLDEPRYELSRPKTLINTLAGGIMGFLVGLAIVFVLEYTEAGVIRSPEDVGRFLEMPVLGAVPRSES
jgi:capsular polysaccharide biosynthesis protein